MPEGQRAGLVAALSASIRLMKVAEKKKQLRDYYAENLRFHWLIVEASGNRQMAASYQDVVQRLHLARLKNLSQDLGMRTSIKEHEDIAAAIVQGYARGKGVESPAMPYYLYAGMARTDLDDLIADLDQALGGA